MFNVKIITDRDLLDEFPAVYKGETIYEEDFSSESDINLNEFLGEGYTIEITNLETGDKKSIIR